MIIKVQIVFISRIIFHILFICFSFILSENRTTCNKNIKRWLKNHKQHHLSKLLSYKFQATRINSTRTYQSQCKFVGDHSLFLKKYSLSNNSESRSLTFFLKVKNNNAIKGLFRTLDGFSISFFFSFRVNVLKESLILNSLESASSHCVLYLLSLFSSIFLT